MKIGCQALDGGILDLKVLGPSRSARVALRSSNVLRNTQGGSTIDMEGVQQRMTPKSPTIQLLVQMFEFVFARNAELSQLTSKRWFHRWLSTSGTW